MTAPATDAPSFPSAPALDGENHLSLSWMLRHPLVGAASLGSAGAGLVHAAAAGTHTGERSGAVAFAITAALQVAWAFVYLARPSRLVAGTGFVLNGSFAAAWIASRTVGLPEPKSLGGVEHVGLQDGIAAGLGLVAVVCAALALWKSDLVARHRSTSVAFSSVVGLAVVGLATVGAASSHAHAGMATDGTGSMDHAGMDMSGMAGMAGMSMPMAMPATTTTALPLPKGAGVNTSDVAFAQSTLATRLQQVRMADIAAANSRNPQVLAIATSVKTDPASHVTLLEEGLRSVRQPVPGAAVLTKSSAAAMPALPKASLATETEMAKLESSFGVVFDRLYLEVMHRLNSGALSAAEQALTSGASTSLRTVAQAYITSATAQQRAIATTVASLT